MSNELASYSYECTGFAQIPNVLTEEQIEIAKELINKNWPNGIPWKFPVLHLGRVFWEMMTTPKLLPLADEFAGEHFRCDHAFGLSSNGANAQLHGGPQSSQYSCFYMPINGGRRKAISRLNFGFCLEGQSPETGGFCYIPGSHKTNDPRTGSQVLRQVYNSNFNHHSIIVPTLKPGDMIMFTEAMVHGDTGWRCKVPNSYRMQIYFMLSPGWACWRDPKQNEHLMQYVRNPLEARIIEGPWSGRFSETATEMGVNNERRRPTISG
jgi:hypothetical protein